VNSSPVRAKERRNTWTRRVENEGRRHENDQTERLHESKDGEKQ
jgi:hypothetical protein